MESEAVLYGGYDLAASTDWSVWAPTHDTAAFVVASIAAPAR